MNQNPRLCHNCGKTDQSDVIDSRAGDYGRQRRYECLACGTRWSTREIRDSDTEIHDILSLLEKQAVTLRDLRTSLNKAEKSLCTVRRKMSRRRPK